MDVFDEKGKILSLFIKLKQRYSLFPSQNSQQSLAQESINYDYEFAEYRVTGIILDTVQYRLFRPVRSDLCGISRNYLIGINFRGFRGFS